MRILSADIDNNLPLVADELIVSHFCTLEKVQTSVPNHVNQTRVLVSYQPVDPPPCSCLPLSLRGRRPRQCTTPTRTHIHQMKCCEG